jgi:predicted ATP-dependent protease
VTIRGFPRRDDKCTGSLLGQSRKRAFNLAFTACIDDLQSLRPIAGLKEKLLAALRGGIKTVLIPEENAKDLVEIADGIKSGLEIVPVSRMDEVLARAMTRKPKSIEWDETTTTAAAVTVTAVPEEDPIEEEGR